MCEKTRNKATKIDCKIKKAVKVNVICEILWCRTKNPRKIFLLDEKRGIFMTRIICRTDC